MRTPRLPVVDWTDAPADLNGLVRFTERRNLVSARVPSHFNWPLEYIQSERCDEPKLQRGTNHPAHFEVGLSISQELTNWKQSPYYIPTLFIQQTTKCFQEYTKTPQAAYLPYTRSLLKANGLRTQQFHFFHHNTTHREMCTFKIVLILSDNCSSLLAANPLRGWTVGWVGYVNTINEPTGSDNRQLSHKIMTVI
jgi:hypothetical protein